ncbi:MAG: hypothetical protein R2794_03825 [Chitinophagales bacterium]
MQNTPEEMHILNMQGEKIYTLEPTAASQIWYGKDANGNKVPQGMYLLVVIGNDNKIGAIRLVRE